MAILGRKTSNTNGVARRFARYLNSPLGKRVLDGLEEGESFILQTSAHTLKVTKRDGQAVVESLLNSSKEFDALCEQRP